MIGALMQAAETPVAAYFFGFMGAAMALVFTCASLFVFFFFSFAGDPFWICTALPLAHENPLCISAYDPSSLVYSGWDFPGFYLPRAKGVFWVSLVDLDRTFSLSRSLENNSNCFPLLLGMGAAYGTAKVHSRFFCPYLCRSVKNRKNKTRSRNSWRSHKATASPTHYV
jgi:hypothetical protein